MLLAANFAATKVAAPLAKTVATNIATKSAEKITATSETTPTVEGTLANTENTNKHAVEETIVDTIKSISKTESEKVPDNQDTAVEENKKIDKYVETLSDDIKDFIEKYLKQALVTHLADPNFKAIIAKVANDEKVKEQIRKSYLKSTKTTLEEIIRSTIFRMEDLETKKTFWNYFKKQNRINSLLSAFLQSYSDDSQLTFFSKLVLFLNNQKVVITGGQNMKSLALNTQARVLALLYKQLNEIILKKAEPVIENTLKESISESFTQLMNVSLKKYLLQTPLFRQDNMLEMFFKQFILSIDENRYTAENTEMQREISSYLQELQIENQVVNKGGRKRKITQKLKKRKSNNRKKNQSKKLSKLSLSSRRRKK